MAAVASMPMAPFSAQPSLESTRVTTLRRKLEALQYKDPFETTSVPLIERVREAISLVTSHGSV